MPRKWVYGGYIPPPIAFEEFLRRAYDPGMFTGELFRLRYISAFELHGHHETWAQGWELIDERHGFRLRMEWLDDICERATDIVRGDAQIERWERWPLEGKDNMSVEVEVQVVGGPLDGTYAKTTPTEDLHAVVLYGSDGQVLTDEPYLYRNVDGIHFAVYADLVQAEVRARVSEPEAPVAGIDVGFELAFPYCAKGEHDFGPWERTPLGNLYRRCRKCQVGQGRIYG